MALGDNAKKTTASTTRKETPAKQNENSDEIYKLMLQTAADAVVTIDDTKNIIFWNDTAEKIWGYTAEETLGKNIKHFVPTEHQKGHDKYVNDNIKTGQNKIVGKGREVEVERKDGSRVPVLLTMSKATVGDKTYFTAFVKDISAEVESRQKAAETAEINFQTLEQAVDAVVTIDGHTKEITFVNPAAERLWQRKKEDM